MISAFLFNFRAKFLLPFGEKKIRINTTRKIVCEKRKRASDD